MHWCKQKFIHYKVSPSSVQKL